MAQLDAMLRALADKGASDLLLAEGMRPTFRFSDGQKPVSQTVLNKAQICALISELASRPERGRLAVGESLSFVYQLSDGVAFVCEVSNNGSFAASVRQQTAPGSGKRTMSTNPGLSGETKIPPAVAAAGAEAKASPPRTPAATRSAVARQGGPNDAPAIDRYLRKLIALDGSDLHLSAGQAPMARIHGEMATINGEQIHDGRMTWDLIEEIIPERSQKEFEESHDADFAHEIPGVARFRANVFMDRRGPGAVFRVIPSEVLTVEDLNLPESVVQLCRLSKGLVLVTGPTGSGKSTTLAAMVDHINRTRSDHIITIEDPIEFVHPNRKCLINQREVGNHTSGFKRALRAALREDPDIVLVGEMRDLETIAIAIETAETGHLVFGTLHTTNAASTVDRIIDQFPADRQAQIRTMLSESLKGVVSQTLLKRTGGGRVAALETLIAIPAIANLIREGKTFQIPSIMQTGKKHGMLLMNDALVALVKKGLVEPDEAYRKAADKTGIANALRVAGFQVTATVS